MNPSPTLRSRCALPLAAALFLGGSALALLAPGCGTSAPAACTTAAKPSQGPADQHCGRMVTQPDEAVCHLMATGGSGGHGTTATTTGAGGHGTTSATTGAGGHATGSATTGAGGGGTGGTAAGTGGAGGAASPYGPTVYGFSSDDDDCKYHVTWSATPICEGQGTTFTVVAITKSDGKPAAGARTLAEVYLNDSHPAPNSNQTTTEGPPGTYTIGPIVFDAPGKWTVRFHFHEECTDVSPMSPHGHAAYYVDVP